MDPTFKNKIAIITGAGSGMGLTVAKLFHSQGACLVLTDISGREADAAKELGDRAVAYRADVSQPDDVAGLVDLAVSTYGGVDILCNIAGVRISKELLAEQTLEDFDREFEVNMRAVFLTMKYAIPHMINRGGGSIVNVSSTAAIRAWKNMGGYSAAKAGVIALTKVVALEYGPQGIRANVICPGTIETPMLHDFAKQNPGRVEYLKTLNPTNRLGLPEEIAATAAFLASDASSYVTGCVLPVDGGQTI